MNLSIRVKVKIKVSKYRKSRCYHSCGFLKGIAYHMSRTNLFCELFDKKLNFESSRQHKKESWPHFYARRCKECLKASEGVTLYAGSPRGCTLTNVKEWE